ncbi:MAG: hypothetical protein U9R03_04710, partial [Candidatus Aerophobetes bacterium]|nr:hypothetical protein [Candidatus Aerophobetes bacterium]
QQGRIKQITSPLTIDKTPPVINKFTVTGYEEIDNQNIVYYGTSVQLSWQVEDQYFDKIEIWKYSVFTGHELVSDTYAKSGYRSIAFDLDTSIRKRDFALYIKAFDQSGNSLTSESIEITYIDDREYQEPADTIEERRKITKGLILCSVVFFVIILLGVGTAIHLHKGILKGFRFDFTPKDVFKYFTNKKNGDDNK